MFTGIIEELGTLESIEPTESSARLRIRSPHVLTDVSDGDSIAVNGCCLTVTEHDRQTWTADVITTTLQATTDRKSTRLNSSHVPTSSAVFALNKKRAQA